MEIQPFCARCLLSLHLCTWKLAVIAKEMYKALDHLSPCLSSIYSAMTLTVVF